MAGMLKEALQIDSLESPHALHTETNYHWADSVQSWNAADMQHQKNNMLKQRSPVITRDALILFVSGTNV